ncbi:esterase-like activity of phytase family protein [uncultured Parvibaculum sp.]|uniref:esterase-like activity of phytase family protein n=1 Tax=uncultured Parvibaculum sp. TaxID=291828 RepID=UPI0030D9C904
MRRPTMIAGLLVVFAFVAISAPVYSPAHAEAERIDIKTNPLVWNPEDRSETRTGKLEWAGGIEIRSPKTEFGGWSGLAISSDGTVLLSVSDEGHWLKARVLYDERGRLSGLAEGHMAPMLGLDGKPIAGKMLGDAEGLVVDTANPLEGRAYVSYERAHRIWRYNLGEAGFAALPEQLLTQRHFGRLKTNAGIESIELLPRLEGDGEPRILAVTEDTFDPRGNLKAFIADGHDISWFAVKPREPYKPTDMALLPNGDLLLLERRFSMLAGVGMQMRLIEKDDIVPGALVDGPVLIDVGQRYSIDNMEGLAVREDSNGDLLIYAISDNNFNMLQRTLLLMFRLSGTSPAATADTIRHPQSQTADEWSGAASRSEEAAAAPN